MTQQRATTLSSSHNIMMLSTAVIIALIASNLVLSVDAIRCHQCNSHNQEDCKELRLNTPRAQLDTQYLKECEGEHAAYAFCRKTVTRFEVNGEQRIIRSCGWIRGSEHEANLTCMNADNEGYKHTICSCFEDGCNGAVSQGGLARLVYAAVGVIAFVAIFLRR